MQAIEQKLRDIQRFISQEKQAVVKAKALISACSLQREQLQYISTHLPARLPEAAHSKPQAAQQTAQDSAAAHSEPEAISEGAENTNSSNVDQSAAVKQAAGDKKKRPKAPRRFTVHACIASVLSLTILLRF